MGDQLLVAAAGMVLESGPQRFQHLDQHTDMGLSRTCHQRLDSFALRVLVCLHQHCFRQRATRRGIAKIAYRSIDALTNRIAVRLVSGRQLIEHLQHIR